MWIILIIIPSFCKVKESKQKIFETVENLRNLRILKELDGQLEKISRISLAFLICNFLLLSFFSESVKYFISNKASNFKFDFNKNYRFFIGGIISKNSSNLIIDSDHKKCITFIRLKLLMAHFIQEQIFHILTKINWKKNIINALREKDLIE